MTANQSTKESIQDTIISVIIAFALAFVFRGFVAEAFVIPTGSMAPTLDGAHETFRSPQSGYVWDVGPWDDPQNPSPVQGRRALMPAAGGGGMVVHDPMTGQRIQKYDVPLMSGDRILVLKYLYSVMEPQRYDAIVFKDPGGPQINFIKRLIGLPGDQIALIDGDVFIRRSGTPGEADGGNAWALPGWKIERKPARAQRAVWQKVFDSAYAPLNSDDYSPPWTSTQKSDWKIGGTTYEYSASAPTQLAWDAAKLRYRDPGTAGESWDIDDRYPYDESPALTNRFPVSDIRMRAGIKPGPDPSGKSFEASATITARSHQFQAVVSGGAASLRMRPEPDDAHPDPAWTVMTTADVAPLSAGRVTNFEFWHADQALQLYLDGKLVARAEYDWSPADRVRFATGRTIEQLLAIEQQHNLGNIFAIPRYSDPASKLSVLTYRKPRLAWSFSGSPVTLYRVAVDRDLHYQPITLPGGRPARATHPSRTVTLGPDQFFVCGDNSPNSSDGRFWGDAAPGPDPWAAQIDPTPGIVPRKLLLGKAFFVYFPSALWDGPIPIPDFGRMRFIW